MARRRSSEPDGEPEGLGGMGGLGGPFLKPERVAGASGDIARVLEAKDFYAVLGVERDADMEAVKRAKRSMSLTTHPDKNPGAAGANQAFDRVNQVRGMARRGSASCDGGGSGVSQLRHLFTARIPFHGQGHAFLSCGPVGTAASAE